jgi:hypothetical protein
MNEIICIGTSYTEGGGLYNTEVKEYYKKLNITYDKQSEVAWPSHLSKLLKTPVRNLGKCGSGMDYLIRNVEDIIETEDVSEKLFILEYSSWGRTELWDSTRDEYIITNWGPRNGEDPKVDGYAVMMTTDYTYGTQLETDDFKLWENFLDRHFNEMDYLINRDKQFVNLLYKLTYNKIKFLVIYLETPFWDGIYTDTILTNNSLYMSADDSLPIVKGEPFGMSYLVSHQKERIEDVVINVNDSHPSIEGHKLIANEIYTKLKKI